MLRAMQGTSNLALLYAAACISVVFVLVYWTRRSKRRHGVKEFCYLLLEKKPQDNFKCAIADNSYAPFVHFDRKVGTDNENNVIRHPYEHEINNLLENPPGPPKFTSSGKIPSSVSSHIWVATRSELEVMTGRLSKEAAFAVDTEQHSLRSFLGFTALIQISTETEDYLVDTIALHDEMHILQPVFADPLICKVFHGADNDVLWLQRDFHIYVVNLFDTAKACLVLPKPFKSLAYLLESYTGILSNKMLQREDWRQRPLSAEMVEYAVTDAHYLLYIADCLVTEMKAKDDSGNLFAEASHRSNMISLQLYAKDSETFSYESAAATISLRHGASLESSSCESDVIKLLMKLCLWRDIMARIHDESLRYVLSDQAIAAIVYEVPKDPKHIFDAIRKDDLNLEFSMLNSFPVPSSSSIVCSHMRSLRYLLDHDTIDENVWNGILHDCLGENGTCPNSIFNCNLLSTCGSKFINRLLPKQKEGKQHKHSRRKASRDSFIQKFSCKSPVYHNFRIYASDGRLLCYCDQKKLEWYLLRNLAKLIDEDPPAIMLLFEPKGRPEDEDNDFYIQTKKNICVGCGEGKHYLRYRIIPSCYRIHFPEHLKSHRSHDIVLLCVDCHEVAHAAAEKYKREVAKEFGIPLFVRRVVNSSENGVIIENSSGVGTCIRGVSPLQLRTAALALLRHESKMPTIRHEELTQIVQSYFGKSEISNEDLEEALLVGMSSHERRRLEKKRGLSFNSSVRKSLDSIGNTSKVGDSISNSGPLEKVSPLTYVEAQVTGAFEVHATMSSENEAGDALSTIEHEHDNQNRDDKYQKTATRATKNKQSLLGHGPHGKLVVDSLMKEYGEDGIRQFCQKWRQVFVDAVCPRFLPAGWDVMHSGRREFGEYSVYNPANQVHIEGFHSPTPKCRLSLAPALFSVSLDIIVEWNDGSEKEAYVLITNGFSLSSI